MGTVVSLDVRAPDADPTAVEAAMAWLHDVDRRFSSYRADARSGGWTGAISHSHMPPGRPLGVRRCAALRVQHPTPQVRGCRPGGPCGP
jgi:hypothetical protein